VDLALQIPVAAAWTAFLHDRVIFAGDSRASGSSPFGARGAKFGSRRRREEFVLEARPRAGAGNRRRACLEKLITSERSAAGGRENIREYRHRATDFMAPQTRTREGAGWRKAVLFPAREGKPKFGQRRMGPMAAGSRCRRIYELVAVKPPDCDDWRGGPRPGQLPMPDGAGLRAAFTYLSGGVREKKKRFGFFPCLRLENGATSGHAPMASATIRIGR